MQSPEDKNYLEELSPCNSVGHVGTVEGPVESTIMKGPATLFSVLLALICCQIKSESLDQSDVLVFFSNYTNYLSESISRIEDKDLRLDISKLFNEVSPILHKTLLSNKGSKKTNKLKRIVTELKNIESLLEIVTASVRPAPLKDRPSLLKASRLDVSSNVKDTYHYSGLSAFHQSLLANSSEGERGEVSEAEVVSRLQEVLGQDKGGEKEPVKQTDLLTLHTDFTGDSSKVVPPWDTRTAQGEPTRRPYRVSLDAVKF